jgi:hypothetical protein
MLLTERKLVSFSLMVQSVVPVIDTELLTALAARLTNETDLELAARQIDASTTTLRWCMYVADSFRFPLILLGLLVVAVGAITAYKSPSNSSLESLASYGLVIVGLALAMTMGLILRLIQRRKRFFVGNPYDAKLPAPAEQLLLDLANGKRTAVMLIDYGVVNSSAQRTRDGKFVDLTISSGTFLNRHAPLLVSTNERGWPLVSLSLRHAFTRPIYVICEEEITELSINTDVRPTDDLFDVPNAAVTQEGPKWRRYFLWNLIETDFKKLIVGIRFYDDEVKQLKIEIVLNAFYNGIHDKAASQPVKPAHLCNRAANALKCEADLMLTKNPTDLLRSGALRATGLTGKGDSIDWMEGVLGGNYSQICDKIEAEADVQITNFKLSEKYGVIRS